MEIAWCVFIVIFSSVFIWIWISNRPLKSSGLVSASMPYIELLAKMSKRRKSGYLPDIRAIERFIKTEVDENCYGYAVIMERFQELKMCKKDDANQVWKKYDAWRAAIRIAEFKALWPLAFAILSMYPLALIAKTIF